MVLRNFRAEVRLECEQWVLVVPALDNLRDQGDTLLEAEQKLRRAIAKKVGVEQGAICIELQDRRGIARERTRRMTPTDLSHPAILT
jgi:predicted RNase H-like HicB family nuclease